MKAGEGNWGSCAERATWSQCAQLPLPSPVRCCPVSVHVLVTDLLQERKDKTPDALVVGLSKHLSPMGEDILGVRLLSLIHSFLRLQISMRPPTL